MSELENPRIKILLICFFIAIAISILYRSYSQMVFAQVSPTIDAIDIYGIPEEVSNSNDKLIQLFVTVTYRDPILGLEKLQQFEGSGFAISRDDGKNLIILTARHVVFVYDNEYTPIGEKLTISPAGLHTYGYFQYLVRASYKDRQYILKQVGVGRIDTEQDFIAFQTLHGKDSDFSPLKLNTEIKNRDTVYMAGFRSIYGYSSKRPLLDLVRVIWPGTVAAIITEVESESGLKKMFRIGGQLEQGYSGGPLLNKKGEVIGISNSMLLTFNLAYAISAEDLDIFVRSLPK